MPSPSGFTVIPALDVRHGRCVRLVEGDPERLLAEGGDPVEAAERFVREGARILHLVDLDGAFGAGPSLPLLEKVVAAAGDVPVQVGGGYRSVETLEAGIAAGASRVIVGTAAVAGSFLARAVVALGPRLAVAVDARDGRVAVTGWTRTSPLGAAELARRCADAGVARLVVTNTRRDGGLAGPDVALLDEIMSASGLPVVAAGGVSSLGDLRRLSALGCEAAIVGSAIWLGRFSLREALAAV